jgi:rhomboid family GlyGly-CTERM serine protease
LTGSLIRRLAMPGLAWGGLAVLLGLLALAGWSAPRAALDWQPTLALIQPWRAFSAIGVHYSVLHLLANLAGAAAVGALGVAARARLAAAVAWAAAWPLTQVGLLLQPALIHYGGLSGVLHAGVAVVSIALLWAPNTAAQRWVGLALLVGLAVKVLLEAPWGAPLRYPAHIDIAVAPLAHASGLLAGLLCAIVAHLFTRTPSTSEGKPSA